MTIENKTASNSDKPKLSGPKIKGELYKTEQCKNWVLYGTCRYGESCRFAHGFVEQRGRERHTKYKSSLCKDFPLGKCTFGIRCNFAHSPSELISSKNELKRVPDKLVNSIRETDNVSTLTSYDKLLTDIIKSRLNKAGSLGEINTLINDLTDNKIRSSANMLKPRKKEYTSQLDYAGMYKLKMQAESLNSCGLLSNSGLGVLRQQPNTSRSPLRAFDQFNSYSSNESLLRSEIDLIGLELENMVPFERKYSGSKISPFYSSKPKGFSDFNQFENKTGILATPQISTNGGYKLGSNIYNRDIRLQSTFSSGCETTVSDITSLSSSSEIDYCDFDCLADFAPNRVLGEDYTVGYLQSLGQAPSKQENAAF